MQLRWAMAGCKSQALLILEALGGRGFTPSFVAVPPHAPASDRDAMEAWGSPRGLDVLRSRRLSEHVERLSGLDLLVVCRFELLPPEVFTRPRLGTVNVHSSLLPQYRGIHPVSWALVDGASETGVTVHAIDDGVDTGAILRQRRVTIEDRDDLHSLTQRLDAVSAELMVSLFEEIRSRGVLPPGCAQQGEPSFARRRRAEDGRVDWSRPARAVFNLVRALPPPLPAAFAERADGTRIELTKCELLERQIQAPPGTVAAGSERGQVEVVCGDGRLARLVTPTRLATGERLR